MCARSTCLFASLPVCVRAPCVSMCPHVRQVGFITFFLSSILDNLTSTIVMVSLLRKLMPDPERRR